MVFADALGQFAHTARRLPAAKSTLGPVELLPILALQGAYTIGTYAKTERTDDLCVAHQYMQAQYQLNGKYVSKEGI